MSVSGEVYPDYCIKPVLVLGCGNYLFGDDGFGPAVVRYCAESGKMPDSVCYLNAGTSARKILFNITLSDRKPLKIILVDAMDCGQKPGTVVSLALNQIPENKLSEFSAHQMPTSNLLRELRDLCGVDVKLVVLQPVDIPPEVKPGLSRGAESAIRSAVTEIEKIIATVIKQ